MAKGQKQDDFDDLDALIAAALLDLAGQRGNQKSICPSDAARAVSTTLHSDDWPALMQRVHATVERLAQEGRISISKQGVEFGQVLPRGAYRVRIR
jgi:Protein of unknown function (DUF3253)